MQSYTGISTHSWGKAKADAATSVLRNLFITELEALVLSTSCTVMDLK